MSGIAGLKTRKQIVDAAARFLQNSSTTFRAVLQDAIDEGYRAAIESHDWPQLIKWADAGISIVGGAKYFRTPKDLHMLLAVQDESDIRTLHELAMGPFVDQTFGFVNLGGIASQYTQIGVEATNAALPNDQALEVVSDAVGDTTREFWARGTLDDEPVHFNAALNGTTAVAIGNWDVVTEFYVESADTSDSSGATVSLQGASAGTVYGTIAPGELRAAYRVYRMREIPATARTLRLIYVMDPPEVFDDGHAYLIPVENFLMEWTIARGYQYRRQGTLAAQHFQIADAFLTDAQHHSEASRIHITSPLTSVRPFARVILADV